MKLSNRLNSIIDKLLILLALRAKFRGLEQSVSDYHRELKRIFNQGLCYNAIRRRLSKLEEQELFKNELIKGFAKNELVVSKRRS